MNERTRSPQRNSAPKEAIDLTKLRASKLESMPDKDIPHTTSTDLANASIKSTSVARLSSRPEKRTQLTPLTSGSHLENGSERPAKMGARSSASGRARSGVFNNPYYRYQGGPLGRLITFLANILKALESSLLSAFKPRNIALPHRQAPASMPPATNRDKRSVKRTQDKARELQPGRE